MTRTLYVIALGSNRRGRHGAPARMLAAALAALAEQGQIVAVAPVIHTAPLGPSRRRFANAAAILETDEDPPALLRRLKAIERRFGRRRAQDWAARVIDLDIILWSQGPWASVGLTIPHAEFRHRDFVLRPLVAIAPEWRDPLTGRSARQLFARLTRPAPIPRCGGVGP